MMQAYFLLRAGFLLAIFFLTTPIHAVSSGQFSANEIIGRAVQRARTTPTGQDAYTFTKTTVEEERDEQGQLKDSKKQHSEFICRNGAFVKKSSTGNLSVDNEDGASTKMDSEKNKKRKDYLDLLTPELVQKYIFSLVNRTTVNGRAVYEIGFRPRAQKMPAQDLKERILNNAAGTLFIDEAEFELVRADISMNSEISVGGFLGALKRAAFTVERVRLDTGVWFERSYRTEYEARRLAQVKRVITKSECANFKRLDG